MKKGGNTVRECPASRWFITDDGRQHEIEANAFFIIWSGSVYGALRPGWYLAGRSKTRTCAGQIIKTGVSSSSWTGTAQVRYNGKRREMNEDEEN